MLAQRMNLTVGVGDADIIHINQGDSADAGTRQRFCRPGAHAADANHANVRLGKQRQRLLTV
ncbi:hypothetical protein D3C78_1636790 [compost metagenome]